MSAWGTTAGRRRPFHGGYSVPDVLQQHGAKGDGSTCPAILKLRAENCEKILYETVGAFLTTIEQHAYDGGEVPESVEQLTASYFQLFDRAGCVNQSLREQVDLTDNYRLGDWRQEESVEFKKRLAILKAQRAAVTAGASRV